jgi:predicted Zn-dependent protease
MTAPASHRRSAVGIGLRRLAALAAALAVIVASAERARAVSYQGERELGQRFDLTARQRVPMIDDPEVVGYVSDIGRRITGSLDQSFFDYQFSVVRDPRINAFAVPGGYVYVHSGLLARVSNEDELAAVLGHEIAHVHAHHAVRQQEATQALNYAALLGTLLSVVQPAVGALATAASATVSLQYQRQFEQEADFMGARYLQGAGYDPRAMLDFFKQLADATRIASLGVPPYLQTHPVSDERLNHLEAVLKTQQWAPRDRQPPSFALLRVQALARARSEPPGDVMKAYRRAAAEQPDNPMGQYLLGVVSLETGELDVAASALAAARAGGIATADRELGFLALRQRNAEKARQLLTAHVALEPNDARAYVELAKALEALGDGPAASAAYQRALALAPQLETAHHGLGLLAGRAGKQGDGFYHLATAARLDGDYATALNQYSRAAPLLPAGDARANESRQWMAALSDYLRVPMPETE